MITPGLCYTAALTYSSLALTYKPLEREALAGILVNAVDTELKEDVLEGVISNLASVRGAEPGDKSMDNRVETFLRPILGFLLEEFLLTGHLFTSFPFRIFNCSSIQQFAQKFEKIIVPRSGQ